MATGGNLQSGQVRVKGFERHLRSGKVVQVNPFTERRDLLGEALAQQPGRPGTTATGGIFPGGRSLPGQQTPLVDLKAVDKVFKDAQKNAVRGYLAPKPDPARWADGLKEKADREALLEKLNAPSHSGVKIGPLSKEDREANARFRVANSLARSLGRRPTKAEIDAELDSERKIAAEPPTYYRGAPVTKPDVAPEAPKGRTGGRAHKTVPREPVIKVPGVTKVQLPRLKSLKVTAPPVKLTRLTEPQLSLLEMTGL